jgi:hypothetical protein
VPRFQFGEIPFWLTPVSIMKCFVAAADWRARGTQHDIHEFRIFSNELFPFLINQPNDMGLEAFTSVAIAEVDAIQRRHNLRSELIFDFGWTLKHRLNRTSNHDEAWRNTQRYRDWFESWVDTPLGQVARGAAARIAEWGVRPLQPGLAAVNSFGNAVCGQYNHSLRAVCVQLDVVCRTMESQLNFIETLLHEQVHAVIHQHMGDDPQRRELVWLNELAAVLTSQHAIFSAALATGDHELIGQVAAGLKTLRGEQRYGPLASAVLRDTHNALVAWRAWQAIFDLPLEQRRDYARQHVIRPILNQLGWQVTFPYRYDGYLVTVFA